jgi:hypothetical protein
MGGAATLQLNDTRDDVAMRLRDLFKPWPSSGKLQDVRLYSYEQTDAIQLTINEQGKISLKDFLLDETNSIYKHNALKVLEVHKGEDLSTIGELDVEPLVHVLT